MTEDGAKKRIDWPDSIIVPSILLCGAGLGSAPTLFFIPALTKFPKALE